MLDMKLRGLAVFVLVVAGLLGPAPYTFDRAEREIAAQVHESERALDAAVQQLPDISVAHKRALLACIDHHLACNRQDLVAAEEANEHVDARLADLAHQEIAEYRATERRLLDLRRLIEMA